MFMNNKSKPISYLLIFFTVFLLVCFFLPVKSQSSQSIINNKIIKPYGYGNAKKNKLLRAHLFKVKNKLTNNKYSKFNILFNLEFKIFLGAGDLKNAAKICREALNMFPGYYRWWQKCGQVYIWMGNTEIGLKFYYKAFMLNRDKNIAEKLYKFYIGSHQWNMAVKMLDTGMISSSLKDRVFIYTMAGSTKKLINYLTNLYKEKKSKKVLNYIIYTYWQLGKINKTIKTIKLLRKTFGLGPKDIVMYSNILAIKMNYKKAFDVLKNFVSKAPSNDYIYWDKLSDLGWMLGHYKTAVKASMHLANLKTVRIIETKENANGRFYKTSVNYTPGRRRDFERIYLYYSNINPQIAIKYALSGWKKYRIKNLFDGVIYLASKEKRNRFVIKLIKSLSVKDFTELSKNAYFVLNYANALVKTGRFKKAENICLKELNAKFNSAFLSELIYMELNAGNIKMLKYISSRWGEYAYDYPSLAAPFASLNMYFENSRKVLMLSKNLKKNPTEDNQLAYSDILSLRGDVHEANGIRHGIWIKMKKRLQKNRKLKRNVAFMENFLSVSMKFESGKKFLKMLKNSKKILPVKTYRDFILSYKLYKNERDKVKYLRNKKGYKLKPWMKLDIAMSRKNTYSERKLLKHWVSTLPIRDRVEALKESGNIGGAFTYAYKGYEENEKDYLLYRQFRDLADEYSNRAHISFKYINWQGYREVYENMYLKYNLADGFSLTPNINIGKEISYDNGDIIDAPYKHYDAGVTLKKEYSDFNFKASAGVISSIGTNPYFSIEPECKITDTTILKLFYGEHIKDDDTLFTYLGGLKREIKASIFQNITNRASFTGYISQDWYMSQNNVNIGNGNGVYGEFDYKLTGEYTDIILRAFAQSNRYYDSGNDGDMSEIFPVKGTAALPSSYNLAGGGFTLGSNYKNKLEKSWRPFLYTDILYETGSGLGYDMGAGYGGSILGYDNLSIGFNYYSDFQGSSAPYMNIFLSYSLFY